MNKVRIKENSKRKIFKILLITTIISFILGILFLAIVDKNGKKMVIETIFSYIKGITTSDKKELFITLKNNVLSAIIIWFLGISLFGLIFQFIYIISKSFILGFSFSSFIYTFKIRGILIGSVYLLPSCFNLIIYFILGLFASKFSICLYNYLFKSKEYDFKKIMKRYLKVFGLSILLLIISSLVEVYFVPYVLKLFTKSYF